MLPPHVAILLSLTWPLALILIPGFLLRSHFSLTSILLDFYHLILESRSHLFFPISWGVFVHYSGPWPLPPERPSFYLVSTSAVTTFSLWQLAENRFYQKSCTKPQAIIWVKWRVIPGHLCLCPHRSRKIKDRGKERSGGTKPNLTAFIISPCRFCEGHTIKEKLLNQHRNYINQIYEGSCLCKTTVAMRLFNNKCLANEEGGFDKAQKVTIAVREDEGSSVQYWSCSLKELYKSSTATAMESRCSVICHQSKKTRRKDDETQSFSL